MKQEFLYDGAPSAPVAVETHNTERVFSEVEAAPKIDLSETLNGGDGVRPQQAELAEKERQGSVVEVKSSLEMSLTNAEQMTREGFYKVPASNEARMVVFAGMGNGEFKLMSYPEGDINTDPAKKNQIHSILYKTPEGDCVQKILTGEWSPHGWTEDAAQALINALNKENRKDDGTQSEESAAKLDKVVLEQGFSKAKDSTESRIAMHRSLGNGEFTRLLYPDGEVEVEKGKAGYVHTIVYKDSKGDVYEKSLKGTDRPLGWTAFEAKALVDYLKQKNEKSNQS